MTDATLARLNGLRELNKFEADIPEVAGPGLEVFSTTPKMKELILLKAGQLKDEHLAPLGKLEELQVLSIGGAQLTGAVLQHLAPCKKLETLHIGGMTLTAAQAGALRTLFPALKSLRLGSGSLTKETLSVVGQFKWLETLDLGGNPELTDDMLAPLSGLTGLRNMDFGGSPKFNGTGLAALAGSSEIRHLKVTMGGARVTGPALPVIAQTFPKLENLEMMVRDATDDDFKSLSGHPNLGVLYLYATRVSDDWLATLATLSKLKLLRFEAKACTGAGIEHLLQSKNLQALDLEPGSNLDASVVAALKKFAKLKNLTLRGPTVPAGVADELKKALPGCKVDVVK